MARYLNERQVGFDVTTIGFPSLGDCMALVIQDVGGLYGFHLMPGDVTRAKAFLTFMTDHGAGGGVRLFGSCFRPRRYATTGTAAGLASWQAEMTAFATAVDYVGEVSGFDTSRGSKIVAAETTYVEYRLAGGVCTIHFKRMSKMNTPTAVGDVPDDDLRVIRPPNAGERAALAAVGAPVPVHVLSPNNLNLSTASVVATKSNAGELHAVPNRKIDSFTVA